MAMVDVDDSSLPADSQPKSIGFVWGLAATWRSVCIHQMNRVNSRNGATPWWQHHKYRRGIIMIMIMIIIIINHLRNFIIFKLWCVFRQRWTDYILRSKSEGQGHDRIKYGQNSTFGATLSPQNMINWWQFDLISMCCCGSGTLGKWGHWSKS